MMSVFQQKYWERDQLGERRAPTHPVINAYVNSKLEHIRRYVELKPETRLLDVGCGNGFFTYYFDKICNVVGVDYSQKMLDLNPVKKTYKMNAADLKFDDGSFDVVFCHALLHHVEDIDLVVCEMRRVSRKYVIVLEPNRNNPLMFLFNSIVPEERKALKFSLNYTRDLLERNDIKIMAAFSQGMIVPNKTPTMLLCLLKKFEFRHSLGMTNFVIGEDAD